MEGLYLKNAHVIDALAGDLGQKDLLMKDGRIARMEDAAGRTDAGAVFPGDDLTDVRVIDATGLTAFPGLTDPHVHFRDPGQTQKETIETGAKAAAAGGFTSVIMMGNTVPRIDSPAVIRQVLQKGAQTDIRVATCANVTKEMAGKEIVDMDACLAAGAVLFSDDGLPLIPEERMREACAGAAKRGRVISLHEEAPEHIGTAGVNDGEVAQRIGIPKGADRKAEIVMVKRDIRIAEETGAVLTIQHISAKESVALIREAVKRETASFGRRLIHAEATPHHFSLTQDAVLTHGTNAKMNPPLREEADRRAIIEGLCDGTIDMIATDHAPHTKEEKDRPFPKAPSGITGLETALSLALRELVQPGYLTFKALAGLMSYNAAALYGLTGGEIAVGKAADLCLFDPDAIWTFETTHSASFNTPFRGETLPGVVRYTICGGRVVYENP